MMSKQLIESIIDDNLVSAKDIFTERMEEILECKLYEEKRRIAAEMNEAFGSFKLTGAELQARKKAGWPKASDYFEIMNRLKSMETKHKSDIEDKPKPTKRKKKLEEELSQKELDVLKARGQEVKKRITAQTKATAKAIKGRIEREIEKRGAKKAAAPTPTTAKPAEAPKTTVTGVETPVDTTPRQMPKLDKPKPPRDMSVLAPKEKGPKALRKAGAPRGMDIITRYRSGLEKAKDLQSRGSEGAVRRFKKAYGVKALPAQAASGLSIIKRGLEHIADS